MTKDKFKSAKILSVIALSFLIFAGVVSLALSASAEDKSLSLYKSALGDGFGSVVMKSAKTGDSDITCEFNKYKVSSYCKGNYSNGEIVTLTATPASGSKFSQWGGACSGINPVCTVTLSSDRSVTVFFYSGSDSSSSSSDGGGGSGGPYTLTLKKGASSGTGVVGIDSIKDCYMKVADSSCSYTYSSGATVTLQAVPDSGMTLSWSGACSSSSPDCSITMNNNKTAVADFTPSSDLAPVINFFYADPAVVKTGGTSVLHGQATNVSKCELMSRDDSSLGASGYPTIYKEWWDQWTSWGVEAYYWRDVSENFTWSTAALNKDGNYTYRLACRGKGAYDNQFSGIIAKDISVSAMTNVTLNVTKSGGGAGTVTSDTFSPSFAWANNGLVKGEPRYTGYCSAGYSYVSTNSCNSLTVGSKVYDGSDRGASYGDSADAFPVYDGLKTATARKYTNSCGLSFRSGGTVNEWQCKDKVFDIDCGAMCSANYVFGDNKKVTLTATPNYGSTFSKWTGVSCEGGSNNGSTCKITMGGAKNVNAEFIICASCASSSSSSGHVVFSYAGGEQTYKVPTGITSVEITASGAQGGSGYGGYGGKTSATVNVTSGETLYIYVGGMDGYNGGGWGRAYGGGASDIRQGGKALPNRIIVAGGGGGYGDESIKHNGGAGGGLSGNSGTGTYPGQGGKQASGGIGGGGDRPGSSGTLGVGGSAGTPSSGGGGGGYYGGGGGGDSQADGDQTSGGGGGSSYTDSKAITVSMEPGVNYGSGEITITPN
ncbi:MAG: hypothetical protein HW401_371 [Parcubacteria group bacterium]|nr:hypothetical protein [Parcubacteria group bacterium]